MKRIPNVRILTAVLLAIGAHGVGSFCLALDGYISRTSGIAPRWLAGDSGEPILYRVDADQLPTGVTTSQALTAVSNAFQAWANVSSLSFKFEQMESFGTNADAIPADDGRMRVQLHDSYHRLQSGEAARGGRRYFSSSSFPNGGLGGRVGTNEFDLVTCGYVIAQHTNVYLQNTQTLAEALCHEIGHAISLGHSSTNYPETNSLLAQAGMYLVLHMDGRGAALNSWDIQTVQVAYPTNDTPPYGFERVILALTASPALIPTTHVNQVQIQAFDRQNQACTMLMTNSTANNGTFVFTNGLVSYSPIGLFLGDYVLDPASGYSYDLAYVRISDGTHLSGAVGVRVTSLLQDANANAMPDIWSTLYGLSNANAYADADGDGLSNLAEWALDTNPTNAVTDTAGSARLAVRSFTDGVIGWNAKPYELYQVTATTNLTVPFAACRNPSYPTSSNATTTVDTGTYPTRFFRVEKLP